MDSSEVAQIVGSAMSVSDKIRALNRAGHPRADIARLIGKRYQHVRNVLEADKLHPPRDLSPVACAQSQAGLEEPARSFGGVYRLSVEADGALRLPPEVLAVLGVRPGGVLISELGEDRLVILSARAALERIDALMAPFRKVGGPLASEELIAERRAEAARESDD